MSEEASGDGQLAEKFHAIVRGAGELPEKDRLGYLKGALLGISDPMLRQATEDLALFSFGGPLRRRHVVALVHGIRTRAVWFQPLAALLDAIPGVSSRPLLYGYFDAFRFLVPFLRRGPIEHLKSQLALIARENQDAHVSVVAHSFGTYAVCKLLEEDAGLRLYRVVFCGAVAPQRFQWHRIGGMVEKKPIINECGTRDVWPVLAGTTTWGYGPSGTHGFQHTFVMNRFYHLAHSGFFSPEFYEKWWVPLWADPDVTPPQQPEREPSPAWVRMLGFVPLKWILVALLGFLATSMVARHK